MSDPRNLQELADSLGVSANSGMYNDTANPAYAAGYRNALLDTRATVLAMIQDINRRIANNNRVVNGPTAAALLAGDPDNAEYQGILDGRVEAYEDVRGETPPALHKAERDDNSEHYSMCKHCGKEIKRVPGGNGPTWVHEATGMVVG